MRKLLFVLLTLGAGATASARIHTVRPTEYLALPTATPMLFTKATAIDGNFIIALADRADGRAALLYRRDATGFWAYQRTLLDVTGSAAQLRSGLEMKNGIAVIQLNDVTTIWERVGENWVRGQTAAPLHLAGGFAISGTRILAGENGCDYNAQILEKSATGIWQVTGHLTGAPGVCNDHGAQVELNYDYAMIRNPDSEVRVYRRNGATLEWPQVSAFELPEVTTNQTFGPMALQKTVAVSPGSGLFRRTGSAWNYEGQIKPYDYGNGTGKAGQVEYRDGVLLTTESWGEIHAYTKVYAYIENAAGGFDHVAILETPGFTYDLEISGRTVVAGAEDESGYPYVSVFTLPAPIVAAAAIANDFDAGDVSGFEQTAGSQYALAGNIYNRLYRQSSLAGESFAVVNGSDWSDYQSIEADITPTAFDGADRYIGLAVRYQDAANNYYVTWRSSNVIQLKRKIDGAFVTLGEQPLPLVLNQKHHVRLSIAGDYLNVFVDGQIKLVANDKRLTHGRAALTTYRARADFDNVYVSPTEPVNLLYKDWVYYWYDFGRRFTELGGNWMITGQDDPEGISQTTTTGTALAINGIATEDQTIDAHMRLDSFAGAQQSAWFGVLARYVDERNYYYLSIRSSNQLQIRKVVGGVVTVLKAVTYTATPGAMHQYKFSVLGNELHASVDGALVATAIDNDLRSGQYGMGTYRTAATWQDFMVTQ